MNRVAGKIALVTGAASGLGKAIAERLAAEGAVVVLTDIDAAAGTAVAASIGNGASFHRHDVTSGDDWARIIAATEQAHGRLDVLVNNAGITLMGNIEEISIEDWRQTFAVDVESI